MAAGSEPALELIQGPGRRRVYFVISNGCEKSSLFQDFSSLLLLEMTNRLCRPGGLSGTHWQNGAFWT